MNPLYVVERWPLGWLLVAAPGHTGVPLDTLSDLRGLAKKSSVLSSGIAEHYKRSTQPRAIVALATARNAEKWAQAIDASLAHCDPQERWWKGWDTGRSSAAIFAVFCDSQWKFAADEVGGGRCPLDADDFGRCKRLIDRFPEWRARLAEVAAKYPESKWGDIVAHWEELSAGTPTQTNDLLRRIEEGKAKKATA